MSWYWWLLLWALVFGLFVYAYKHTLDRDQTQQELDEIVAKKLREKQDDDDDRAQD